MTTHRADSKICITGLGLVTAVGLDCKTSVSSIQAGIKRSRKLNHYYAPNKHGYEDFEDGLVTGHPVLDDDDEERESRMMTLLGKALLDLKSDSNLDDAQLFQSGFFLALPDQHRVDFNEDETVKRLNDLDGWMFLSDNPVQLYPKGHAAMMFAMGDAIEQLKQGKIQRAVIAGTDSMIGFKDLSWLNNDERLKTHLNPDGLIPGEAASAVLLEKIETARRRKGAIKGKVNILSTAIDKDKSQGSGLALAIRNLFPAGDSNPCVDSVLCDFNGEPHRATEWGMVQSKVFHSIEGVKNMIYPAIHTGDTGAASAGVAICLATRAMETKPLDLGHDEPAQTLIVSSSDTGERGALLLLRPTDSVEA